MHCSIQIQFSYIRWASVSDEILLTLRYHYLYALTYMGILPCIPHFLQKGLLLGEATLFVFFSSLLNGEPALTEKNGLK